MDKQPERLDAVSKTLLTCHAITHMLVALQGEVITKIWVNHVQKDNEDYKGLPQQAMKEGIKNKEDFLQQINDKLAATAEEIFEFMNGGDMITEIDIRIIRPYTQIIGDGLDEVDNPYDGTDPN